MKLSSINLGGGPSCGELSLKLWNGLNGSVRRVLACSYTGSFTAFPLEVESGSATMTKGIVERYPSYQTASNPEGCQPQEWARQAKAAGMQYMILTAKHHDGFCLFDSQWTDYKATNTPVVGTWYGNLSTLHVLKDSRLASITVSRLAPP